MNKFQNIIDGNTSALNAYQREQERAEREAKYHFNYRMNVAKDDIVNNEELRDRLLANLESNSDLVTDLIRYAFESMFMPFKAEMFRTGTIQRKIVDAFEIEQDELAQELVQDGKYNDYRRG